MPTGGTSRNCWTRTAENFSLELDPGQRGPGGPGEVEGGQERVAVTVDSWRWGTRWRWCRPRRRWSSCCSLSSFPPSPPTGPSGRSWRSRWTSSRRVGPRRGPGLRVWRVEGGVLFPLTCRNYQTLRCIIIRKQNSLKGFLVLSLSTILHLQFLHKKSPPNTKCFCRNLFPGQSWSVLCKKWCEFIGLERNNLVENADWKSFKLSITFSGV